MFDQSQKQLTVGSSVNLNMIQDKFSFGSESVMRHRYGLTRQNNTVRKTHKHDQVPKPKNICPYIKYFYQDIHRVDSR